MTFVNSFQQGGAGLVCMKWEPCSVVEKVVVFSINKLLNSKIMPRKKLEVDFPNVWKKNRRMVTNN